MLSRSNICKVALATLTVFFSAISGAFASELDLHIPALSKAVYSIFGHEFNGDQLLMYGMGICLLGMIFGLWEFFSIKEMPAHKSMLLLYCLLLCLPE